MATVASFNVALIASTGRFTAAMSKAERQWDRFTRNVQRSSKTLPASIRAVVPASLAMAKHVVKATALAGAALSALGGIGVKLAMDFEEARVAFTTFFGDARKADRFVRQLEIRGRRTPFGFAGLQESARSLLAFGFTAEQVLEMIEPLGDAVAAMGGGQDTFERIARALGQMKAKGKVSAEELLQLAEAGVPAYQFLAEEIGTSIPQAMEMAQRGAIPVARAIDAIISGMRKRFAGAMAAQMQTNKGFLRGIRESTATIARGFGEDIIRITGMRSALQRLNQALGTFADLVSMVGFMRALERAFPPWMIPIIVGIAGAIAGALVPAIVAWLIPALKKLGVTLWTSLAPLWPWMLVGAALAGIAYLLMTHWNGFRELWQRTWQLVVAFGYWGAAGVVRGVSMILSVLSLVIPSLRGTAQAVRAYADQLWASGVEAFQAALATAQGAQDLAETGNEAAEAQQGLGDALAEARKQAQDNLQSFDEVHQLQDEMAATEFELPEMPVPEIPGLPAGGFGAGLGAITEEDTSWVDRLVEKTRGMIETIGGVAASVGEHVERVRQTFGRLGESAQQIGQTISQRWADVVRSVGDAWRNLESTASLWTGQVAQAVAQGWAAIAQATQQAWAGIVGWLAGTWDGLARTAGTVWNGLATSIGNAWNALASGTQSVWTAIVGWLSSTWDGLSRTTRTVWQGIEAFFGRWWSAIESTFGGALAGMVSSVGEAWERISSGTQSAWGGVRDWLAGVWDGISATVSGVWDAIAGTIGGTWERIHTGAVGAWDALTSWLTGIWDGICTTASATWQGIVSVVSGVWDSITAATQRAWESLRAWLSDIWNGIVSVATTVWDSVTRAISTAWDVASALTRAAWITVRDWLSTTWDGIKSTASMAWNAIASVVGETWDAIEKAARKAWDGLSGWLSNAWQDISNTAGKLWAKIADVIGDIWDGVVKAAKSTWGSLSDWLSDTWKSIGKAAEDMWNQMPGYLQRAADSAVKLAKKMATDIGNTVRGMKDEVVSFAQQMVDDVIRWFSSLGTRALEAVKNWTQGVIAKVRDMYMAIVGGSIVPNTVNQTLTWFQILQAQGTAIIGQLGAKITNIFSEAFAAILGKTINFGEAVKSLAAQISYGMQNVFMDAFNGIINGTMTLGEAFRHILGSMGQVVQNVLVQQLAQAASDALATLGKWALGVLAKVGAVIVALIKQAYATLVVFFAWSGPAAPFLAAGVIAAAIAGLAALTSQVLNAVGLAEGGIVTGPTLAMMGEGGRREAVIPLERDNVIADSVGQAVYEAMLTAIRVSQASGQPSSGDREIVLQIDGTRFARAILPAVIREGQRQGLQLVVRPQGV